MPRARKLSEALQERLPNTIESIYIYGSTALNAYVKGSSDIDFLVFVNRTLSSSDSQLIMDAHRLVELIYPNLDIMGAYIRQQEAGKPFNDIPPFPKYHDKTLDFNGNGDINPVTWWVLKKYAFVFMDSL
ncbi:nucleotidyltransferase domain-containing protein [Paenibacillus sp. yr247]|uniref:nucleotidyltransferase domain-containing protein n=1 Tax=Paenibacillus sp. yr247 TaxID=1761880 RepID=UPI000B880C5F|nr:nucleotidyltransferase domain-containing protein [Paenibacillus sp. yr247]